MQAFKVDSFYRSDSFFWFPFCIEKFLFGKKLLLINVFSAQYAGFFSLLSVRTVLSGVDSSKSSSIFWQGELKSVAPLTCLFLTHFTVQNLLSAAGPYILLRIFTRGTRASCSSSLYGNVALFPQIAISNGTLIQNVPGLPLSRSKNIDLFSCNRCFFNLKFYVTFNTVYWIVSSSWQLRFKILWKQQ